MSTINENISEKYLTQSEPIEQDINMVQENGSMIQGDFVGQEEYEMQENEAVVQVELTEEEKHLQRLKLNYYKYLNESRGVFSRLEYIVNDHQRKEYDAVFKELLDNSLPNVQNLTEEETDIVRNYIGAAGKEYATLRELSENTGYSYGTVHKRLKDAFKKMTYRIIRGFPNLTEAALSGEISEEELRSLPIFILNDVTPKISRFLFSIDGKRINTIGDLIDNSMEKIGQERNFGLKSQQVLFDYIHSLGLEFKDDNIEREIAAREKIEALENYNKTSDTDYSTENHEMKQSVKLKILLKRLQILNDQEMSCDEQLNKILAKKQELQVLKAGLLNELASIQLDDTVEEGKVLEKTNLDINGQ